MVNLHRERYRLGAQAHFTLFSKSAALLRQGDLPFRQASCNRAQAFYQIAQGIL
jgi:hypothetical protein